MDKGMPRPGSRRRRRDEDDEDEKGKKKVKPYVYWAVPAVLAVLFGGLWALGVFAPPRAGAPSTDPDAKLKLERLFGAYRTYCARNNAKPPADQKQLRDFLQKQPPEEKKAIDLPDNLDDLFVNPRDGQPYEVKWGSAMDPMRGSSRAVMWEKSANGDGKRWVALANGYVEILNEQRFGEVRK